MATPVKSHTAFVERRPKALREEYVEYQGGRLRYLVGGDGPPLVLCHGFLGSAENFEEWFTALLPRRRLVIPDLPGCGASMPLAGPHTADALACAVAALVDDLCIERFDLGGLCLGGSVAQSLLRQRGTAVDRLIVHTPLLAPHLVRRRFRAQVALATAPGVFALSAWLARQRVVSDLYKRFI
ncbi:MAG TPA: alpha/beta fold hydrolase, partial [Candidatus Sulfotelmatobacter sp.]|nr:alpha/beta fold hydrolase [Candidatus Sulfotelmatobacter sp.]